MPVNNTNINNNEDSVQTDPVASSIEKTLLKEADLISSANTGIEDAISGAISGIEGSQEASAARIRTDAARQASSIQRTGMLRTETSQEGRRGFATQTAVLRDILDTTNAELKDLDQREQDALRSGEAEAASQIAGLKLQALEFQQKAKQDHFANLLGIGQFAQGQAGIQIQRDQLTQQIARDAATMTQNEFNNDIATKELEYSRLDNEFDRTMAMESLNLRKQEVAIQQQRANIAAGEANALPPSTGFGDYDAEIQIRGLASDGLSLISNRLNTGEISEEEALAEKLNLFSEIRTATPDSAATTEALLGVIGLPVAESAEASFQLAEGDLVAQQDAIDAAIAQQRATRNQERQLTVPKNVPFAGGIYSPGLAGTQQQII